MFIELLAFTIIGILFGIFTGITPGIHINLVAVVLLSVSPFLLAYFFPLSVACLIISMSVTHTFIDFIPSTFLGAPEEATALAVLPAHKLLLRGMAYEAVRLSSIGSLLSLIAIACSSFLLLRIVPFIYDSIKDYIGWILLAVVLFMIFRSKDKNRIFWSAFVFLLSGVFGIIVFSMNIEEPLFPMFSGMFGVSMLLSSIFDKVRIPKQRLTEMIKVKKERIMKATVAGSFSGGLTSIFPGLGPAQAAIVASQMAGRLGIYSYIILIGGIGTASMMMSLITLFSIEKARNGSIIVVQQLVSGISISDFYLFIAVSLIAGGIAVFLSLYIAKIFSAFIEKVNYQMLCLMIIIAIALLSFLFGRWLGTLILIVSASIGLLPPLLNIGRNHLMGSLLLPVIFYFIL